MGIEGIKDLQRALKKKAFLSSSKIGQKSAVVEGQHSALIPDSLVVGKFNSFASTFRIAKG